LGCDAGGALEVAPQRRAGWCLEGSRECALGDRRIDAGSVAANVRTTAVQAAAGVVPNRAIAPDDPEQVALVTRRATGDA
jgi:hypothetical protein